VKRPATIFCVAGEASGDASCAALVQAVRERLPDAHFRGVGGRLMAKAGVQLLYDSSRWGAVGVVEALRVAPALWLAQQNLKRRLTQEPPDLLVLVDFGAFNVPLAKWAKARGMKVSITFRPAHGAGICPGAMTFHTAPIASSRRFPGQLRC